MAVPKKAPAAANAAAVAAMLAADGAAMAAASVAGHGGTRQIAEGLDFNLWNPTGE